MEFRDELIRGINFILATALVADVLVILFGVFMYMINGGNHHREHVGVQAVLNALVGLVIIIVVYILVVVLSGYFLSS